MATESSTFLDAIIAWSSSHLALQDGSYELVALQHRCSAFKSLYSTMASKDHSPELILASCLVLCSMESILGGTSKWYDHLVGASEIIRSASAVSSDGIETLDTRYFTTSFDGRWLLRNFAYHDIMMTVTMDRKPLLAGHYWDPEEQALADSYFGLASGPILLISNISCLNADMLESTHLAGNCISPGTTAEDDEWLRDIHRVRAKDFLCRAHRIETQLKSWTCTPSADVSLVSLAGAYRSAALIYLYRTMRRQCPSMRSALEHNIAEEVTCIVEKSAEMPLRCLPECTLLFPLFMAGGEAESEDQIHTIRQRMRKMVEFRRFLNVQIALTVLEELWSLNGETAAGVGKPRKDWLDVLDRRKWRLTLS